MVQSKLFEFAVLLPLECLETDKACLPHKPDKNKDRTRSRILQKQVPNKTSENAEKLRKV